MEKTITSKKANTIIVKVLGYAAYTEVLYNGKTLSRGDIEEDTKKKLLLSLDKLVDENLLPTGRPCPKEMIDLPFIKDEIVEWASKPKGKLNSTNVARTIKEGIVSDFNKIQCLRPKLSLMVAFG